MIHLDTAPAQKIPVGISDCLTGAEVRYNGGHKRSALCCDRLSEWFDLRPFCPEVAIGLGVPRPTLRLIATDNGTAVSESGGGRDVGPQLRGYGEQVAAANSDLCGFIFTAKSPSCGLFRVKVYRPDGHPTNEPDRGAFAKAITEADPLMPVEESGRLNDTGLRENFLMRVFAYHQWRSLRAEGLTHHKVIAFYSRHKYLMLAHSPEAYRRIGRLLATAGLHPVAEIADRFIELFMQGLAKPAPRRRIVNALEHMRGHARRRLSSAEKAELSALIGAYRQGYLPLIAVIVMLRHHLQHGGDRFAREQVLLEPFPDQLLRA